MQDYLIVFIDQLKELNPKVYKRLKSELSGRGLTVATWEAIKHFKCLQEAFKQRLQKLDPKAWYKQYRLNTDCCQFAEYQSYEAYLKFQLKSGAFIEINGKYYNKFKAHDYLNFCLKKRM
ncbi:MAG: hypothetical protein MK115_03320 [Prochlorococcus sp. ALOHA_ZT_50]|nr:hypothetical protein [Prochlorococcus sp. ALOHA_ZT_50]